MLAQTLVHYTQPRVLDPACGDGAFLVAASRQLPTDCLHGVELDPAALTQARQAVPGAHLRHGHALIEAEALPGVKGIDWSAAFPAAMAAGGFDVVVGNPPYLNLKRGHLSPAEREWLGQHYRTAVGQWDAFALFVERSLALLRPGGRLGLVLPKPVLASESYAPVRRLLHEHAIELVAGAGQAFAGAAVEAVVLVACRGGPAGPVRFEQVGEQGQVTSLGSAAQTRLARLPFANLSWRASDAALDVVEAMDRAGRPLGDQVELLARGVEAGRHDPAVSTEPLPGAVPLLRGADVERYALRPSGLWYQPGAAPRGVRKDAAMYARRPKILLRRVAPRLLAALDSDGWWVLNTLYVLTPRPPLTAEVLLACLNSRLLSFYLQTVFLTDDRLFPYLRLSQLRRLPVPEVDEPSARRLTDLVRAMLSRPSAAVDEALEAEVARLYGVVGIM